MDLYQEIASFYDLEHADHRDDVDFYLNLIQEGPVLEVGVGTARIMRPLLDAGLEVWGVDESPAMLERARRCTAGHVKAHLAQSSIVDLSLDVRFPVCVMSLNVLWHLQHTEAQSQALRVIRRHLSPNGLLVIDLSNPLTMADRGATGELRQRFRQLQGERSVTGFSAAWDDEAEQRITLLLIYDEVDDRGALRRSQAELVLRYTFRAELELILGTAGFDTVQVLGSYDLEPYRATSTNLIVLARAR